MMTKPADFNKVKDWLHSLAEVKENSTARYATFNATQQTTTSGAEVCFHNISTRCNGATILGIAFQGYGGFREGDRFRPAIESDLYTNITYPFVNYSGYHYNEVSLQWLECILDPAGPFKTLLPLMNTADPVKVQEQYGFIFPDVSSIPARLTWCFAIASRLGFANARVVWRYLHLLAKGLDKKTAFLIAGGFEHEVRDGVLTGKIIKSYTAGFLGVDVTAYAGRFLTATPVADKPYREFSPGTYGSSEVFKSGKIDMAKLRFDSWDEVIEYTQKRGREQSETLKIAA
jgi:hypothetical protein